MNHQLPKVINPSKKYISKLLFRKTPQKISLKKQPLILIPQKKHFRKTLQLLHQKMPLKIAIKKIFFISAFINVIKGKISINKSLIMCD